MEKNMNIPQKEIWDIFNPEVSILAAKAAVEIDKFLNKKNTNFSSLSELKNIMKHISSVDLPTSNVLRNALAEGKYFNFENKITQEEMEFLLKEILSKLENITQNVENIDKNELIKLEKFCIALSKTLLSFKQKFYNFHYRELIFPV